MRFGVEARDTVFGGNPEVALLVFGDGLDHVVDEAVAGAVVLEGEVTVVGTGDTHAETTTRGTNPYPPPSVLVDALDFVAAQLSVVVIVSQVVLRVGLQGIGREDVDSVTVSHPYPAVRVFDDGARAALSEGFVEEVAEGVSVVLLDGQIQSATKGAYPHTTFLVAVKSKDMVVADGRSIIRMVDIPLSANAEAFTAASHP